MKEIAHMIPLKYRDKIGAKFLLGNKVVIHVLESEAGQFSKGSNDKIAEAFSQRGFRLFMMTYTPVTDFPESGYITFSNSES